MTMHLYRALTDLLAICSDRDNVDYTLKVSFLICLQLYADRRPFVLSCMHICMHQTSLYTRRRLLSIVVGWHS